MSRTETESQVHLYWATGCTSCLRAKEFLERNDVPFVSHNVVEDRTVFEEMAGQGLPEQVPLIRRGDEWADAQLLETVATIAGVDYAAEPLAVEELYRRLEAVLDGVQGYLERVPEDELATDIPNRPRSYGELVYHVFSIPETFLRHEAGASITSYPVEPEWASRSKTSLATYGDHVRARLADWREHSELERDWSETADVFYGEPTVHLFFERTTWHAGQHARQLEWLLEERLAVDHDPFDSALWDGLPMPEKVWDAM